MTQLIYAGVNGNSTAIMNAVGPSTVRLVHTIYTDNFLDIKATSLQYMALAISFCQYNLQFSMYSHWVFNSPYNNINCLLVYDPLILYMTGVLQAFTQYENTYR